jgi:hypothetical protein
VGLNYHRLFGYIRNLGISTYYHLQVDDGVVSIQENHVESSA